ncbi:unnamed protein product [Effrenium voratum]|nr:unnamed protein product [Effrenium voratum]
MAKAVLLQEVHFSRRANQALDWSNSDWLLHAKAPSRARGAAFLEATEANQESSVVEDEASEVLAEAEAAKKVATRAAKFAWAAVFVCGVGASLDLLGATFDFRASSRSKADLDEQEAELDATGWPAWLHQTEE